MTEIVLFHVLAATAGAAFGLLAIWAGIGRLHWSMRFIPVTAAIVSLFPVPAFDLALVFVSQALVVVVPLLIVRRFTLPPPDGTATEAPPASHPWRRFTVADLFRATLLISAVFGVAAYLPGEVRESWWKYALVGGGFGVATLAGTWAALANPSWWIRLGVVCLVAPLAGVPTALDRETYFFSRGVLQWPWCAVTTAVALLVAVWLLLARTTRSTSIRSGDLRQVASDAPLQIPRSVRPWLAWIGVGTVSLAILLLPTLAYHDMIHPAPIPIEPLPEPNAYHDLSQVGDALVEIALSGASAEDAKQTSQAQERRALLDEAHDLLRRSSRVPIDYNYNSSNMHGIQSFRQLARDLQADGNGQAMAGDTVAAERSYLDGVELGLASAHGGLLGDFFFGRAIAAMGIEGLRKLRDTLSPDQRRTLITILEAHESRWEPLAVVCPRELAWWHRSLGWRARISFTNSRWSTRFEKDNHGRSATLKLLICELALAQYMADHGGPPEDLAVLVPKYLPEVPKDPFSGRPLVYRTEPAGYVLYSVGQNGLDDGGQRGASFTDGDLFLDPESPNRPP